MYLNKKTYTIDLQIKHVDLKSYIIENKTFIMNFSFVLKSNFINEIFINESENIINLLNIYKKTINYYIKLDQVYDPEDEIILFNIPFKVDSIQEQNITEFVEFFSNVNQEYYFLIKIK